MGLDLRFYVSSTGDYLCIMLYDITLDVMRCLITFLFTPIMSVDYSLG
jgi:hypothetical protein